MRDDAPPALRVARDLESATGLDPAVDAVGAVVDPALATRPRLAALLRGKQLGHSLHPLLTDLPLGLWTGTGVLDLVGGERSREASDLLLGLGIAVAVPTAVAGVADWSLGDRRIRRVGLVHAALNGAGLALYGTSWLLRRAGRRTSGVAVSMAGHAAVTAAGYLGGHMTLRLGAPSGRPRG